MENKQEELRDKFNLQVLPASVQLEDGTWKELFNREQYNEVIDYLFAIGLIDDLLKAERNLVVKEIQKIADTVPPNLLLNQIVNDISNYKNNL